MVGVGRFFGENREVVIIFFLALIARIVLIPYSFTVDADSVSRTYIALEWVSNPHFVTHGVWAPIHTYLNALFLIIVPDNVVAIKIEMSLFASLTVFPIYYFTKSLFNHRGALFAALIYTFSPIVFRNSYHNLSGVVYAFFLISAIYLVYRAIKENKVRYALLAGGFMTIAAGIRYEAWLLMGVVFLLTLLYRNWKLSFAFAIVSGIFPAIWMIGNFLEYNDPFYSVSAANHYNLVLEGINESITKVDKIKRLVFFPFSLFLSLSPFISALFIYIFYRSVRNRSWNKDRLIWAVPFVIVFITYIVKAYNGGLLLHHRYSVSLVLLLSPFIGFFFLNSGKAILKSTSLLVFIVMMIPVSFTYANGKWYNLLRFSTPMKEVAYELYLGSDQLEGVPQLKHPLTEELGDKIDEAYRGGGLIMDFISWKETAYLSLQILKGQYTPIYYVNGNANGEIDRKALADYFQQHRKGTLVLLDESKFENMFTYNGNMAWVEGVDGVYIDLEFEKRKGDIKVFTYRVEFGLDKESFETDIEPVNKIVKDVEFFEAKIYRDKEWLEKIKEQVETENSTLKQEVLNNAKYMVEQEKIKKQIQPKPE